MENTGSPAQAILPAGFNRFTIPLKWAAFAAVTCILFQFISYQYLLPYSFMGGTMIVLFIQQFPVIPLAFYIACGMQQRRAMGGYITMREVFSALFIVVLAINLALAIWGILYILYINPNLPEQLLAGLKTFMIRVEKTPEFIEQALAEKRGIYANSLNIKSVSLGLGQSILWHSLVALVCSFILRKRKPEMEA